MISNQTDQAANAKPSFVTVAETAQEGPLGLMDSMSARSPSPTVNAFAFGRDGRAGRSGGGQELQEDGLAAACLPQGDVACPRAGTSDRREQVRDYHAGNRNQI